jgi:putative transposase
MFGSKPKGSVDDTCSSWDGFWTWKLQTGNPFLKREAVGRGGSSLLEKTREKYPFYLHTYCLMTNHVHLQLETIDVKPGKIMNYLHSLYASYFNTKYELTGHLFQGRYGAELIDSFDYELDVSKYIHLNPFEAEMVEKPEDYPWSSCRAYVFQEKNPHIRTDRILSFFPEPQFVHYKIYITPRKLINRLQND